MKIKRPVSRIKEHKVGKTDSLRRFYKNIKTTSQLDYDAKRYSSILARDILLTETFINRLRRDSKRPIVVIGNGSVGKPYIWSIKKKEGIYIRNINYPSTDIVDYESFKKKLLSMMKRCRESFKNPLFVFVDASKESRMPASFAGHGYTYTKEYNSLSWILKKSKMVGYDWSMNDGRKNLPKSSEINLKKTEVILFNPLGKHDNHDTYKYGAYHDRGISSVLSKSAAYKKHVLDKVNMLKKNLFSDKKKS